MIPEKVWIAEKTAFCGCEITEYIVSECTYIYGELKIIVVNNECTLNYQIDIEEYQKYHHDSFLCFSYEEALNKIKELEDDNK